MDALHEEILREAAARSKKILAFEGVTALCGAVAALLYWWLALGGTTESWVDTIGPGLEIAGIGFLLLLLVTGIYQLWAAPIRVAQKERAAREDADTQLSELKDTRTSELRAALGPIRVEANEILRRVEPDNFNPSSLDLSVEWKHLPANEWHQRRDVPTRQQTDCPAVADVVRYADEFYSAAHQVNEWVERQILDNREWEQDRQANTTLERLRVGTHSAGWVRFDREIELSVGTVRRSGRLLVAAIDRAIDNAQK